MVVKEPAKRSETIRRKREKRPRKVSAAASTRHKRVAQNLASPPILIRGGLLGETVQERRHPKKVRRRYDVALGMPGVEMQLPSLPRVRIGWRLLSFFLLVGCGLLAYALWSLPIFQVTDLEITGLRTLKADDLNAVADIVGKSILFVNPHKIEQGLMEAFPSLESIAIEVKVPAKVLVSGTERKPVLSWQQDGKTYWVDAGGTAYPQAGENGPAILVQSTDAPFFTVSQPDAEKDAHQTETTQEPTAEGSNRQLEVTSPIRHVPVDLVNAILEIARVAPENTPLSYDIQHGFGWKDSKGWMVYFGSDPKDMDIKLSLYKAITKKIKKEGVKPVLISLEYTDAPYYRLEQ